ncbi:hypothetical protein GAB14E_4313 [Colwellia psychrerythraea]|uniref:Uncharacterized protein n=1 Tax=Colwellia psychrerythraea TaxID=28229 RepID=A0A099KCB5_COLPS|nr:hypothetical protein GAB14E_4313 [Colwellia psychrerythraea]
MLDNFATFEFILRYLLESYFFSEITLVKLFK